MQVSASKRISLVLIVSYLMILFGSIMVYAEINYCPIGACRGDDIKAYYPDPEAAKIMLTYNPVSVSPDFNNDWEITVKEFSVMPDNSSFYAHYADETGICSNSFNYYLNDINKYNDYFDRIHKRIIGDTGHEGEVFMPSILSFFDDKRGDNIVWESDKVDNLKDVKMILLNGNPYIGAMKVFVAYDNYADCKKIDHRIENLPYIIWGININ